MKKQKLNFKTIAVMGLTAFIMSNSGCSDNNVPIDDTPINSEPTENHLLGLNPCSENFKQNPNLDVNENALHLINSDNFLAEVINFNATRDLTFNDGVVLENSKPQEVRKMELNGQFYYRIDYRTPDGTSGNFDNGTGILGTSSSELYDCEGNLIQKLHGVNGFQSDQSWVQIVTNNTSTSIDDVTLQPLGTWALFLLD